MSDLSDMNERERQENVKKDKQNDYLSAHSDSAVAMTEGNNGEPRIIRAFPVGEERVRINAAFDQLVSALKDEGFLHEQEEIERPGNTQYQLRPGAIDDINNAISDKNVGGDIILTDNTPKILLSQKGVRNLPLAEKASHIRENVLTEQEAKALGLKIQKGTNYHGLGVSLYARVIDDLDSVSLAYRGTKNADDVSRRENYFLLISQHNDKNGDRINVPVTIDQKRDVNHVFVDANLVNTVFGRKDLNDYIADQVRKGNLVRIKNRSNANSEPPAPIAVDYTGIASKDSISQIDSNSQSEIQNQPRVSALTNRDVLDIASGSITVEELNDGEADSLRVFRSHLDTLREIEEQRAELGRLYDDQSEAGFRLFYSISGCLCQKSKKIA